MMGRKQEPKTFREVHEHLEACRKEVDDKFSKGDKRMDDLHDKIDKNTHLVEALAKSIDQFLQIWSALEGFAKVVNWGAKITKALALVGVAVATVWGFLYLGGHK